MICRPALRLIAKLALTLGVGAGGPLPIGRFQLIHQAGRLARRDDELRAPLLIGLHRLPTVEAGIGSGVDRLYLRRQGGKHALQMPGNLCTRGPIPIAQLAAYILPRLGQKSQNRLVAFLPFVLRVVALTPAHLVAEQRMHRRVGVQRHHRQTDMGRLPHPFAHPPLHFQQLPRNA